MGNGALDSTLRGSPDPDVSVILPAFCEADNLPTLVPRVDAALKQAGLSGEIIVVDDDSADGTAQVCEKLAESFLLRVLVRKEERGLSSAVLCGMRSARGKTLVVLDADLSHPPEKIPELVRALEAGADFALGSRYVEGGSIDEEWGLLRFLNSRAATLLALPLKRVKDPMSGFFALRRSSFERADGLNPIGYKIGLELMVKCGFHNVKEVPIAFAKRAHGQSKLSWKEQANYLRHLSRLYEFKLGRWARPLKYLAVGASGMVVDLTFFGILLKLLATPLARALAIWIAMTWNFVLNRQWTFSDRRGRSVSAQYVLFCLSCLVGGVMNWGVSVGLIAGFGYFEARKPLAAVCGIAAGTAFNYVLCLKAVFAKL